MAAALWLCGAGSGKARDAQASPKAPEATTTPAQRAADPAGPLATDRPGNGNAATTVPAWRLQLETSANYAFVKPNSDDAHQLSLPSVLRLGILPRMELRVGSGLLGIDARPASGGHTVSATDTFVGTKVQALRNDGWTPHLAVMVDVYLPSGRSPFTNGVVVPEARAAAAWGLPRGVGLLLNLGTDVPEDASGVRHARLLYVVNLGYTLPCLAGRLSLFVESFGQLHVANGSDAVIQVDTGAALLLNDDLQLDLFTQHGLSRAASDFQVAFGVSARI